MERTESWKTIVSRRAALTAAMGIGVTVAVSSVTYVASAQENGNSGQIRGPLVIHVRDLDSGRLEIFAAGRRIEMKDKALAAEILRAATKG